MLDFYVAVHGEATGPLLYHARYFIKIARLDIFASTKYPPCLKHCIACFNSNNLFVATQVVSYIYVQFISYIST